jgi:hypothetical protein
MDRRKFDRKFLTYFARVTDRKTGRLLGYLVDLTQKGALLIGDVPLKIDSIFQLRIDLPDEVSDKQSLDIDAIAKWNQPDMDPEFYRTGLEMVPSTDEQFSILEELLSHYSAKK